MWTRVMLPATKSEAQWANLLAGPSAITGCVLNIMKSATEQVGSRPREGESDLLFQWEPTYPGLPFFTPTWSGLAVNFVIAWSWRKLCLLMPSPCFHPSKSGLLQDDLHGHRTASRAAPEVAPTGLSPPTLPCFSGHQHPHEAFFPSEVPYLLPGKYVLFQNPYNIKASGLQSLIDSNNWLNISELLSSLSFKSTS